MDVPFNDLRKHHLTIKDEIEDAINLVIDTSSFVRGPQVEEFERSFSNLIGIQNCVSCANGTDAIYISMKALEIKPGDEVIVPAHSWISTSETVTQAGGKVVFCDTLDDGFLINPDGIAKLITPKTVGIIPVHLFGHPADMDKIMAIANENQLWVIEDCAQAHLAEYKGKQVGTFGNAATFSFYPGKNLGAMGDAGAIVTNNKKLADKMAAFARHGGLTKGSHIMEGINSRMDGIQAAILNVKLPLLESWTLKRKEIANKYIEFLDEISEIILPFERSDSSHVWHLFVIQHEMRDELAKYLKARGVQTIINYPICLPLLPAYSRLKHHENDFPIASRHQKQILSLPIFPEITDEQIKHVCNSIKEFFVEKNTYIR